MQFHLPEQAKGHFNQKADELLLKLKLAPQPEQQIKIESSEDHLFTKSIPKDYLKVDKKVKQITGFGKEVSRYFESSNGAIGLFDEDYAQFEKFVEQLSNKKEFISLVSPEFISDTLFDWLEKQYNGELKSENKFLDYLDKKSEDAIKKRKISIPIDFLAIQKPFKVGNVLFEYYSKDFFNKAEEQIRQKSNFEKGYIKSSMENIRKRYQGVVCSSIDLVGEEKKCIELAIHETEMALMILRFFSPTVFFPEIPSYFGRMGQVEIPKNYILNFENEYPRIIEEIDEKRGFEWLISEEHFRLFREMGLDVASKLIIESKKSKLDELLLTCFSLFNRCITAKELQDKLVFALVTIETLLLQNSSEPIQSNVGLRLAFLTGSSPEQRKETIELVKDAYVIRSSYLHHGKLKEDLEVLRKVQRSVWEGLRTVLLNRNRFTNQNELISFIQNRILQ